MTGSVVNTLINSQWATGSGGTRVGYASTITANAQSASATITLSAGNAASNNAGGTASIAAGLIRIGTNAAHIISTTGSFGPISVVGALTASVVSASTYIGVQTATSSSFSAFATSASQAVSASFVTSASYSLSASFAQTASIATSASFVIGLAPQVATFGYAITGSNRFDGNQTITGSLNVSSSTGVNENIIRGGLTIVGDNNGNALGIASGSVAINSPQGTGFFYSNLAMTSSGLRINGDALVTNLIVTASFGGPTSMQVAGNASVTQSLYVGGQLDVNSIGGARGLSITGSAPTILSGSLSGSLITNLGDTYNSTAQARSIVTIDSASMATLISGATTNANTIYFVI
jgi:hypothetical protein